MSLNLSTAYRPFESNAQVKQATFIASVIMLFVLAWVVATSPTEVFRITSFIALLFGLYVFYEIPFKKNYVAANQNSLLIGIFLGLVIVGLLASRSQFFNLATPPLNIATNAGLFYAIYVIGVAPYLEERVFGEMVVFGFSKITKNILILAIAAGGVFAAFHLGAYNADPGQLSFAFAFRVFGVLITNITGNLGFMFGAHFANNLVKLISLGG